MLLVPLTYNFYFVQIWKEIASVFPVLAQYEGLDADKIYITVSHVSILPDKQKF